MIVVWIIGLLLCFLGIWLLKNSRIPAYTWCGEVRPERPVLKMWVLLSLIIPAIIPIISIIEGIIVIIRWGIAVYGEGDWKFTKEDNKVLRFLNKPIK